MSALVLRIKFPPTYPLIYKTLRIDSNLTVNEAVKFIGETLNVACGSDIGLFLPDEKRFLDGHSNLSDYDNLQEEEFIEYKSRLATAGEAPSSDDKCCIVL